jgi:diguanylate cyclase (GGDEF)-like protein
LVAVRSGPIQVLAVGAGVDELIGASVEPADDLLGALAQLADGDVDVVLLSLDLPDGQGADVVRTVRERAPEVPVIAIAAPEDAERALAAGASDVVPEDASPELLTRAVRYAVGLHRMRTELNRREVVDEITGLYNARGFEQFATHHLALARRSNQPIVLVTVRVEDLDDAGDADARDRSLRATADVLRAAVRDSDVLARIGPGVFGVLLTSDAAGAETAVLSRIVDAVAEANTRSGRTETLSLSIGAAASEPGRPLSLDELLDAASPGATGRAPGRSEGGGTANPPRHDARRDAPRPQAGPPRHGDGDGHRPE